MTSHCQRHQVLPSPGLHIPPACASPASPSRPPLPSHSATSKPTCPRPPALSRLLRTKAPAARLLAWGPPSPSHVPSTSGSDGSAFEMLLPPLPQHQTQPPRACFHSHPSSPHRSGLPRACPPAPKHLVLCPGLPATASFSPARSVPEPRVPHLLPASPGSCPLLQSPAQLAALARSSRHLPTRLLPPALWLHSEAHGSEHPPWSP